MNNAAKTPRLGGATAAQAGYEFQLNVSILAALRMLLITKSASRLTLEPANEEDLEADLEPAVPGRVAPSATLANGYKLVIQVKLRSGEPWSIRDVQALLNHGVQRTPAKHHLDQPDTRYLLITNGSAKGVTRNLMVADFEESPEPAQFPESLRSTLPHQPEGRLAIWPDLSEELIHHKLRNLLGDLLHVPRANQEGCLAALCHDARRLMSGTLPGVWTRTALLAVIREHGGYLASAAELDTFVQPANFQRMLGLLRKKHAIILTGPSGTGKTLTALALCDAAKADNGEAEIIIVSATDDPARMRRITDTGPTLFYIEDPWGQYSLLNGSDAWTEQLPRFLSQARADRQYVVTTRNDMLNQAHADERLNPWTVTLDAEQYANGQLATIYDKRMNRLPAALQTLALDFQRDALDALETPLELHLFFTNLVQGLEVDEFNHAFFQRLLGLSRRDAVEGVVAAYLTAGDTNGLSTVLWALLVARGQIDRPHLVVLQRQLRRVDRLLSDGLDTLMDRLIATGHLRQPGSVVTFSHPSVRAGFELFLKRHSSRNDSVIEHLISALTVLPSPYTAWGLETAARVADVARSLPLFGQPLAIPTDAQTKIDEWLEAALMDPASDFQVVLQLAADVGSSSSTICELARWFIHRVQRGADVFLERWTRPSYSEDWYARIRNDPRTFSVAERFVIEQLPNDNSYYPARFAIELDQLAEGLAPAFIQVASGLIGLSYQRNVDVIALGAVRNLDEAESVFREALDSLAQLRDFDIKQYKVQRRHVDDGHFDAAYEEHFDSQDDDDTYGATQLVQAFIKATREERGWLALSQHPHARSIARYWAFELIGATPPAGLGELTRVIELLFGTVDECLGWDAVKANWNPDLSERLEHRLRSSPTDPRLRQSLTACAVTHSLPTLLTVFAELEADPCRYISLLIDVRDMQSFIKPHVRGFRARGFLDAIPPDAAEICKALGYRKRTAIGVGPSARSLLESAASSASPAHLSRIIPILLKSEAVLAEAISRWLRETDDKDFALEAATAAIALGDKNVVWQARFHCRADARQAALDFLASTLPDPLPDSLLALGRDPGYRVRRALVRILAHRPHPLHLPILLALTRDTWSNADRVYDEAPSFAIARAAMAALAAYGPLSDETADILFQIAIETPDRGLRQNGFSVIAGAAGLAARTKLADLMMDRSAGWRRVDAMNALTELDNVEPELLEPLTAARILKMPPVVAVAATALVGCHTPTDKAVSILERLGQTPTHRVLLLLGAFGLYDRAPDQAKSALKLLGSNHPAQRCLTDPQATMASTVLDNLGDVRLRKFVRPYFVDRFDV